MRRSTQRTLQRRRGRPAIRAFVLAAILAGATGPSCDGDSQAVFRQETASSIGEGVRTIVNALIDGAIETIEQAGDGPAGANASTSG